MSAEITNQNSDDLGRSSAVGVLWSAFSQAGRQLVSLAVSIVLARLLGPKAYGLIGMVVLVNGFSGQFVDVGLGSALVQRRELRPEHLSSVFWMNIGLGVLLCCGTCAAAPLIAPFFHEPELVALMRVSSLGFVIKSLGVVQASMLSRRMQFKGMSIVELAAALLGSSAGLALALRGGGVWSLVVQNLAVSIATVAGNWFLSPWRPDFAFSRKAVAELIGYGGNLIGFGMFNYLVRNADNLVIGRCLGTVPLGLYGRAYSLVLMPLTNITEVLSRVMFPTLSRIQGDQPRVRSVYLRATRLIALISMPVVVGMLATADTSIRVLLGSKWAGMVPVFRILCLAFLTQPVGSTVGWLYMSQGRTDLMFRWGVASGVIYVASYLVGLTWGIEGVAWAYACSGYLILWYPAWSIPGRLVGLTFARMLGPLLPSISCACLMGLAVWAVGRASMSSLPIGCVLALQVLCGMSIYYALIAVFFTGELTEFKTLLTAVRGSK